MSAAADQKAKSRLGSRTHTEKAAIAPAPPFSKSRPTRLTLSATYWRHQGYGWVLAVVAAGVAGWLVWNYPPGSFTFHPLLPPDLPLQVALWGTWWGILIALLGQPRRTLLLAGLWQTVLAQRLWQIPWNWSLVGVVVGIFVIIEIVCSSLEWWVKRWQQRPKVVVAADAIVKDSPPPPRRRRISPRRSLKLDWKT